MRAGKTYFALQADHAAFQGVLAQRAIAVYLPPPFDAKTTQVELVAIPAE